MLIYKKKDSLIYELHPVTTVSFIAAITLLALIFSHPVYLLGLLLAVGMAVAAAEITREWFYYLRFSLGMMAVIIIVNTIFVQAGTTVVFSGPRIPGLGRVKVTMEALLFSIAMGIRLVVAMSAFCLYTYAVNPDKVLKLFGRFGNRSILTAIMAARLFPLMIKDFKRIVEVYRCRGVKLNTGSWLQRSKNILPVMNVLLLSCLERSFQLAESLWIKGYGSGKRTFYNRDLWRPRDFIVVFSVLISLIIGIWAAIKGWASYTYYPRVESFNLGEIKLAVFLTFILIVPAVLNWGWKRWPLLKSKI